MRKTRKSAAKKLTLNKETLRTLEQGSLVAVHGADSIGWSRCISECIPCDPDLGGN